MNIIPAWAILLLIFALLALAGGLAFWLYEYVRGGAQSGTQSDAQSGVQGGAQSSLHSTAVTPGQTADRNGGENEAQELLRVSRMPKGDIAIFVLGQRYRHLREIKDRHVGGEAVAAIKAITLFAKGWLPALRRDEETSASVEPIIDPEAFLEKLQSADLFPRGKTSRSSGLFGINRPNPPSTPIEPLSTPADEINRLIEERVEQYPHMQKHNIHLTTNLDGGLCFHVGLHTFSTLEEITDPQVRAFVQDTIRKWKEM